MSARAKPASKMLGSHLNVEDLSADDDLLSDLLLDHLEWDPPLATHKMSPHYRSPRFDTAQVARIVRTHCVQHKDCKAALDELLQLKVVQRYLQSKSPKQRSAFYAHALRYLECYLPSSGIEFALTMRYKQAPSAPLRSRRHRAILHLHAIEAGTSSACPSDGNKALTNGTSQIHRRQSFPPPPRPSTSTDGDEDDEDARPTASPSASLLSKADMCVLATQEFKPGDIIYACKGGITDLSKEEDEALREEAAHHRSLKHTVPSDTETEVQAKKFRYRGVLGAGRDFSVIRSARKGCYQLFLGPARFVNHDCEPNVEFYRMGSQMAFRCIRPIHVNEEIVTYYGDNYFEVDNAECLCATCEARQQGAFTRAADDSVPAAGPSRAASATPMAEEEEEREELSIAERALRRHAAEKPPPPSALSEFLNLQEVKYNESNSDTKDGNITRKMLDEPEALLESAGGGNQGPERECYTCGIHFWSKESWWTQEECSRCERHYKLFRADWPSRVPTEGDRTKPPGGPEIVLTSPQEGQWYYYEDRKELPPLSWRKRKALQSASDGTPDSSDAGTPVVLTPLREAENADYLNDPAVKRRRMSLRSHSSLRSTSEGSPTSSPRRKSATAVSRRGSSAARPARPVLRTTGRRPNGSGRTSSSRSRRASSESLGVPRGQLSDAGDESLSGVEGKSTRRTRRSSARAPRPKEEDPPPRDLGLAMPDIPPAPLPEDPPDHDPLSLSASALEVSVNDSAPPASREREGKKRSSFPKAVDATPAPPFTALEPRGPRILGKQATTDALAMHWGASSEGRFRPRTSQASHPPQALHAHHAEQKGNKAGADHSSLHSKPAPTRAKRHNSTSIRGGTTKRPRLSPEPEPSSRQVNGGKEAVLYNRNRDDEDAPQGAGEMVGDASAARGDNVSGMIGEGGGAEAEGLSIATQGPARTSVKNLALAWAAGIGSKRARKPVTADPVLLTSQKQGTGRQSRASTSTSAAPASNASNVRSRSRDGSAPRTRATRRSSGRGQKSPSPAESASVSRGQNSRRYTSPPVKAEKASPSLAPSILAPAVSPSLNPAPSSPAGTSPAASIGSDSSQPVLRPSKRRNLRWGKGKASFSRPLDTLKQLACPPEVAASALAMVARKQPEPAVLTPKSPAEDPLTPPPPPSPRREATFHSPPAPEALTSTEPTSTSSPPEETMIKDHTSAPLRPSAPPEPAPAE